MLLAFSLFLCSYDLYGSHAAADGNWPPSFLSGMKVLSGARIFDFAYAVRL